MRKPHGSRVSRCTTCWRSRDSEHNHLCRVVRFATIGPATEGHRVIVTKHDSHPMHALHSQLVQLGIVDDSPLQLFHPFVRDRDDIRAFRCKVTGVIMLDRIDHIDESFYEVGEHNDFFEIGNHDRLVESQREDTTRREMFLRPVVTNKNWLDVGAGTGSILRALSAAARSASAVEPQAGAGERLREQGFDVHRDLQTVAPQSVDVLTEFHVLEHIPDPLAHLVDAAQVLRSGGTIVIEVPHARDLLLTTLRSDAFRDFTLWSEHLMLHTRESLRRMLHAAGFNGVSIAGVQRYPLANHLHWLVESTPGGHQSWPLLRDTALDAAYASRLAAIDSTDTLVAVATKAP